MCNVKYLITRSNSKVRMQIIPSIVSLSLASLACIIIWPQTSRNLLPGICNPMISFTCVVAMMIAAADVKPTETGPEMKSITKPTIKYYHYHLF